ncbi:MFS transporter [Nesterenkonia sphaerica]|nr:MFS transporter [Nesterenkonia sphaerica]
MGVGPLFPFMLATSSTLVIERFSVTPGQLGIVSSVVFGSAALASQASGWFADKLSVRTQIVLNFSGAGLSFIIVAFTVDFIGIVIAAAIVGCSQAISNPTTNRIIVEVVDEHKRTSWIGFKQSGVQVAQLLSGVMFPIIALFFGWFGAAFSGVLIAVTLIFVSISVVSKYYDGNNIRSASSGGLRESLAVPPISARSATGKNSDPIRSFAYTRLIFAISIFLIGFGVQAIHVFVPLYAVTVMEFSLVQGGLTITVVGVVGMVSRVWWARRVAAGARLSSLLAIINGGAAIGVLLLIMANAFGLNGLIWMAAVVHGMTGLGGNVVINAGLMRAAPAGQIGRVSGVNSMAMYAGFTVGPIVVGLLLDMTSSFDMGWSAALAVFLVGVGAALWLRWHQASDSATLW